MDLSSGSIGVEALGAPDETVAPANPAVVDRNALRRRADLKPGNATTSHNVWAHRLVPDRGSSL